MSFPFNPLLIFGYIGAIFLDVLIPFFIALFIRRRYNVSWNYFAYGAVVFALSQLFTRVPIVQVLQVVLQQPLTASPTLQIVWLVVLSFTAGLFEETGRYLGYRYLVKDEKSWRVALMFGAGHGGIESMVLVGGLVLLGFINVLVISFLPAQMLAQSPQALQAIETAKTQIAGLAWYAPFIGSYERLMTMFVHLALSVLVLQVFLRRSWWWYVAALASHTLVNLVAVFVARSYGAIAAEGAITIFALGALAVIYAFKPRASSVTAVSAPA